MASTNKTVNYEFGQFVGTDKPSWLTDYNGDMVKIDLALKIINDLAVSADDNATSAQASIDTVITQIASIVSSLDAKAPIISPIFTGEPKAPTPILNSNDLKLATTEFVRNQLNSDLSKLLPSGAVQAFAMNVAPVGWLKASGQAVSRLTYASLFSAIGTLYGSGDGSTTFNLPDLRGEFIRGYDDYRDVDSGRVFGSNQVSGVGQHTHLETIGIINSSGSGNGSVVTFDASLNPRGTGTFTGTAPNSGHVGADNRPRNIALLYCIKI